MEAYLKGTSAQTVGDMLEKHVAHELTATVVARTIKDKHDDEFEYLLEDTWPTLVCLTCNKELLELDE